MMVAANQIRLLFAGGGTGGHLFPAIAIADRVTELLGGREYVDIQFVGTKRGLEYRIRESLGYPLVLINVRGLVRALTLTNLLVPFVLIGAMWKVSSLLNQFRPHLVIGTGGYVALPVLKTAAMKGYATVIQEQNSYPGIASRRTAGAAKRMYLGFEGARRYFKTDAEVLVTGNPVRPDIARAEREKAIKAFKLDPNKKTIVVIGGSQGARSVNNAVLRSLRSDSLPDDFQLLWQTGKRDYADVLAEAGEKAEGHALFPFDSRMALVYAAADVAIARAGALTMAELHACALPAILIPYPHAAGDHQRRNAQEFVDRGFALSINDNQLPEVNLLDRVVTLVNSGDADRMRGKIKDDLAGTKPAVDVIAEDIVNLVKAHTEGTVGT